LWEYRSIYLAPLAVGALFLLGFLVTAARLPKEMRKALALGAAQQQKLIQQPYDMASLAIMGAAFLIAVFYCLDTLHGERRDRSILFWKSLPVSDRVTVLSKASIPFVILPLLSFAITIAMWWIMLPLQMAVLLGSGVGTAALWAQLPLLKMSLMLLYHLAVVHALYYAPFFGWFLMVSAWARRAPLLWGILPLFAIAALERLIFNTSHFGSMIGTRMSGGTNTLPFPISDASHPMTHLSPLSFLRSPDLWIGLAVTAVFLAVAIRLRRHREPV
jgi:ABC-2 type transport system permease protein